LSNSLGFNLDWIEYEDLEKGQYLRRLKDKDGLLVPWVLARGIEGKLML
jgi:hypothetical protein